VSETGNWDLVEAIRTSSLSPPGRCFSAAWSRLLGEDLDPDAVLVRHHDDGSETHTTMGIRLAQALHHGTDHRSQICTALTTLGVEPPAIDVWAFAEQDGRVVEVPATS
jgi:uncharacterized damage-inducible protein DinB